MTALMTDEEVIQRVLDHVENGSTDLGSDVWREPVENYRSQARFDLEMELFKRLPMVYCPSAALAQPGDYVARSLAGVPLLSVRGDDGIVRTFHNACRHRGMMLAEGDGNVRGGFVCPYHAWAYGLDGSLKNIAGKGGFPGVDVAEHGLKQVATEERGGLIFVTQKEPISAGALDLLPDLIESDQVVFEYTSFTDEANWKLLLETSMEGYHIKALHHKSFYPFGFDNLNVVETYGTNSRIVFPFKRIEKLRERPQTEWRAQGKLTYVNQLFPNTRLATLSNHYLLVILEPVTPSSSRWYIYRLRRPDADDTPEALERAKRDAAFLKDTGVIEDRAAACSIQSAMAGEGNEHFIFGRFETSAVHFHQHLEAHLDELEGLLDADHFGEVPSRTDASNRLRQHVNVLA
jgi:phenylpropionate dioxygenase-like ring-hydroxylating dioxygenase large terminal subunit